MSYTKTILSGGEILLSDEQGNGAAIRNYGDTARVLFTDKESGIAAELEKEAEALGCRELEFDCYSRLANTISFMKKAGFTGDETKDILAVMTAELMNSKAVRKSLVINFPDTDYIPFRELLLYQLDELYTVIKNAGIPLSREDLLRFDEDLSGIAYDVKRKIQAFILVSVKAGDILIECLYGVNGNNPKFIMCALQGFAREIIRCRMMEIYERICMLEYRDNVRPLLKRLLDSKYEVMILGNVVHMSKELPKSEGGAEAEGTTEDKAAALLARKKIEEKVAGIPYQGNINWKAAWKMT